MTPLTKPLTRTQELALLTQASETGCLLVDEVPSKGVPPDAKSRAKIATQLRAFRQHQGTDGRVHPTYSRGRLGDIHSRPALSSLPWVAFRPSEGHRLLDLDVWSVEPAMIAKAVKQMDLFDELTRERSNLGDVLQAKLGLDKQGRQLAKLAFFKLSYATKLVPEDDAWWDIGQRILAAYPDLRKINQDNARAILATARSNSASMWLHVAHTATSIPGVRLLGFWHSEPLLECPPDAAAETEAQLVDRAYQLLGEMRHTGGDE